jgi:membrane protein DedA with SNARE-associated domain
MHKLVTRLLAAGPPGVFLLAVLDSAGIPLPGGVDALLVVVSAASPRVAYTSAILAVAGSLIGSMILFWLARKGGELYLERHTLSARGQRFRRWFQHYGLLTVFIPALLPIPLPLKIFVISAGALAVPPLRFLLVVALARVPRYLGLAYLGSQLGVDAMTYLRSHVWHLLAFALALFAFLYLLVILADRRRARAASRRQA